MSVDNRTPFPALAFRQYNLAGEMNSVVVARGTFKLVPDGRLVLDEHQRPLVMSDVYDGDPHATQQMACTDLAPFKPGTDVTLIGSTYAPGGIAQQSWTCRLAVGSLEKTLRVYGPRYWRAQLRRTWRGLLDRDKEWALEDWALSEAEPVRSVPLDWRLAYGGRLVEDDPAAPDGVNIYNPIGRGIVDVGNWHEMPEAPAPQIEDPDDPIEAVSDTPMPAGFGPVAPFWRQRQQYAGTYDDIWLAERHPLLPEDFDYRFWQAAPPGLVATPWLTGHETFELENLTGDLSVLRGTLPGIDLAIEVDRPTRPGRGPMVLDGVHFDLRPDVGRVFLTWRIGFPLPKRDTMPVLMIVGAMEGYSSW